MAAFSLKVRHASFEAAHIIEQFGKFITCLRFSLGCDFSQRVEFVSAEPYSWIGAPEIAAYLDGRLSRAEAIATAAQATRNYAKRQTTWFRNQFPGP